MHLLGTVIEGPHLSDLLEEVGQLVFDHISDHGSTLSSVEDVFLWLVLERQTQHSVAQLTEIAK